MRAGTRWFLSWLDERTGLETAIRHLLYEDIPAASGWRHVFGSVALFLFLVQAFTGILLAFNFAPTPDDAYYSLRYILTELTGGSLIRGLHHWGANLLIVVVVMHLVQVAISGAYKKPREVTWILGVALLLVVMAFGLTGYLLPWNNRAYWATVVTTQIVGLTPSVGPYLMKLMGSEDGTIGVVTFARFYGMHVMMLPAIASLLVLLHVFMVRKHGVSPGTDTSGATKKFYPGQAYRDTVAIFAAFAVLVVLAVAIEAPLGQIANPRDTSYIPRPEWYFLFIFQTLKLFEGQFEILGALILPGMAVLALLLVPFLDRGRPVDLRERRTTLGVVTLVSIGWAGLTAAAIVSTPERPAVAAAENGAGSEWMHLTPVDLAGFAYYREAQCAQCHNLVSGEPKPGPTLAVIANRKPPGWIMRHAADPPSVEGSATSASGLNDEQLTTIAAFALKVDREAGRAIELAPDFAVEGARIYQENLCGNCHLVNGVGNEVGPSLSGIGSRRPKEWLRKKIRTPNAALPTTMMPVYELPPDDLEMLALYLLQLPKS